MLREGRGNCPPQPCAKRGGQRPDPRLRTAETWLKRALTRSRLLRPSLSRRRCSKVNARVRHFRETDFLLSFLVISGFGVAAGSLDPDQGRDNFQVRQAPTPTPRAKAHPALRKTLGPLTQKGRIDGGRKKDGRNGTDPTTGSSLSPSLDPAQLGRS